MDHSEININTLNSAFSKKLYIHLAENDNDPNASSLRHNEIVDNQQGLHRLARGRYFYLRAEEVALENPISFNWIKTQEVPNVAHNASQMAEDAVKYLFPE